MPLESATAAKGDHQQQRANNKLPQMKHCSEVQLVSACNCGRRQATRRDPFDYKEANYAFYELMAEMCCFRFSRIALPENTRSVVAAAAVAAIRGAAALDEHGQFDKLRRPPLLRRGNGNDDDDDEEDGNDDEDDDVMSDQSEHALEVSLSPSCGGGGGGGAVGGGGDLSQTVTNQMLLPRARRTEASTSSTDEHRCREEDDEGEDGGDADGGPVSSGSDSESSSTAAAVMAVSNSESRPSRRQLYCGSAGGSVGGPVPKTVFGGMFTTTDDPRSMPRYPSWSLLDSGPYFSYTHSSGLEYSGFVHGSNFLLPWDVPLKTRINKVRKQRVKRGTLALWGI